MQKLIAIIIIAFIILIFLPDQDSRLKQADVKLSDKDIHPSNMDSLQTDDGIGRVSSSIVCSTVTHLPIMIGRPAPCLATYNLMSGR